MSVSLLGRAPLPAAPAGRQWVFGTGFTPLGLEEALAAIVARPAEARFGYVVTPNAQHVVALNRDPLRLGPAYHEAAWLCLCDSRVVWKLAALAGTPLPHCAGSDLTAALFQRGLRDEETITVIGCEDEVVAALQRMHPGLTIHHHNPPMGYERDEAAVLDCVRFVEAHPARYVFLATGSPRSEILAARIAGRGLASGTGLSIGSSLHFITGARKRAPGWVSRAGLEWLHRLVSEPRRMWRRVMFESLPLFRYAAPALLARLFGRRAG